MRTVLLNDAAARSLAVGDSEILVSKMFGYDHLIISPKVSLYHQMKQTPANFQTEIHRE